MAMGTKIGGQGNEHVKEIIQVLKRQDCKQECFRCLLCRPVPPLQLRYNPF